MITSDFSSKKRIFDKKKTKTSTKKSRLEKKNRISKKKSRPEKISETNKPRNISGKKRKAYMQI